MHKLFDFRNKIVIAICLTLTGMMVFSGCEKDDNENSDFDNTIKNPSANTLLSKSETDIVQYLFNRNQLDYSNCLFTRFQKDELGHHHIGCLQLANNLIVFTSNVIFHFDNNDHYYYLSGNLIGTVNLNTKPSMTKDKVVETFISEIKPDGFDDNTEIKNGSFDIEFGYYDLNTGGIDRKENFTKAWKIKPQNQNYPFAYINDETSAVIYYDSGIIIF
jgi:Zn-dependent metalloprotease